MTPEFEKIADAQAAADAVYELLGCSAPRLMAGETLLAYRVRLARGLQQRSPSLINVDLGAVARADSAIFGVFEKQIFSEAAQFARTPQSVPDGQLREVTKTTKNGHTITTYTGDFFAWAAPFMLTPKRVRISRPEELNRRW